MPRVRGGDYRFRGRALSVTSSELQDAVGQLADLWNSIPSLVTHDWGLVRVEIVIGGISAEFDVTDPGILDAAQGGDSAPLVSLVAACCGLTPEEALLVLLKTEEVTATVDRIRPPSDPDLWGPEPGYEPENVLPAVALEWVGSVVASAVEMRREEDVSTYLPILLKIAGERGIGVPEIARRTAVPASTIRDAIRRGTRLAPARGARRRLTPQEVQAVAASYARSGNAAQVERELGVPARTVRDVVRRQRGSVQTFPARALAPPPRPPPVSPAPSAARPLSDLERRVSGLVARGMSASAAGRELGVPERTARDAARRAREKEAAREVRREDQYARLLELVRGGASASAAGRQLGIPERTARDVARRAREEE